MKSPKWEITEVAISLPGSETTCDIGNRKSNYGGEPLTAEKVLMKRSLMPDGATATVSGVTSRPSPIQEEQKGCGFPEGPRGHP